MIIRLAGRDDAPALADLGAVTFTEAFGTFYSPENLALHLATMHSQAAHARVLQDPDARVWLAADEKGEAVGYAVAGRCELPVTNLEATAGELKQIYVRASHQMHHLGSKLMRAALDWLEEKYAPLYIGVWSQNTGAQRLYARHGFQKVAEYQFRVGQHLDHEFILKRSSHWRAQGGAA